MSDEAPSAKKMRVEAPNQAASPEPGNRTPWVEKYRPKTLDSVQAQVEVVEALRACLKAGSNMPHVLFHGPPGTGKTSSILAVAHDLFGPDYMRSRVKELNASDDRGISVVREKIKVFAHGAVGNVSSEKVQSDGKKYPVPSFKLIVLDEADALLPDAQAALRRMMEDFSDVTRFCILCNYVTKIIDPISSRCAKFRFKPLDRDAIWQRCTDVASIEGLKITEQTLTHLENASNGDLRLALVYLQSAARARGSDLSDETFVDISGQVPDTAMNQYLGILLGAQEFPRIYAATQDLVRQGYAATQVVLQIHNWVMSSSCTLSCSSRCLIALKISQTERRLNDRGDDMLQLLDLATAFIGLN